MGRIRGQKEIIDKANEIMSLIEKNERAIELLERFSQSGGRLCFGEKYEHLIYPLYKNIDFEDWEIRLMIHQKKQRIQALKIQLERL